MMKKILSVLIVALLALPMSAQMAYRSGNKYFADGQAMNKKTFAAYMQQNAEAQLANQFNNGYKLSNVGWGLFGGGIGVGIAGLIVAGSGGAAGAAKTINGNTQGGTQTVTTAVAIGTLMLSLGWGANLAGIVCLGVGYGRMHNSADIYVANYNNTHKPQAYLSVKADGNGLGLALNF